MNNVLIIAAHPDDEVLGCGATIPKLVDRGAHVFIALLSKGITSRYINPKDVPADKIAKIKECANTAAQIMKAEDIVLYDFPDNRFDTVPLLDIVKTVDELIQKIKPKIIYTHHGGDLNIDHAITFKAVLTATRPMKGNLLKKLYSFEVASSTEWAFGRYYPIFRPNVFVDVNNTLKFKIEAMKCYQTEVKSFPHPRSTESIKAVAKKWGTTVGLHAAEAFELVWSIST